MANTAKGLLQFFELALLEQKLLLSEPTRGALEVELLELLHALKTTGDCLEVSQQPAQPALIHIRLVDAISLFSNGFLCLLLRADKEYVSATGDGVLHKVVGIVNVFQRLLQIDNVDA